MDLKVMSEPREIEDHQVHQVPEANQESKAQAERTVSQADQVRDPPSRNSS